MLQVLLLCFRTLKVTAHENGALSANPQAQQKERLQTVRRAILAPHSFPSSTSCNSLK